MLNESFCTRIADSGKQIAYDLRVKVNWRNFYPFFYWLFVLKLPFGEEKFGGYYYLVS